MSVGSNGNVRAGYRGLAKIGDKQVRFADASIAAKQSIEAPDMVMGDWDHDAYVYGKIEVGGTISGPVTQSFADGADSLLQWACKRDSCGALTANDVTLYYYCGYSRQFTNLLVNSLNVSVTAGDIAQFSLDVMGTGVEEPVVEDPPHYTTPEKVLTWDKVNVTVSGDCAEASLDPEELKYTSFDFTISNNLEAVYALGQANLFPYDIVPGLRSVTGSVSVYNVPGYNGADRFDDYCAADTCTLTFSLGDTDDGCGFEGTSITMKVRFHRIEPTLGVGPITSTVAFTGVTHQTGLPWEDA